MRITEEMARERPDLNPYVGRELTVIAWLWARTVKSPNPCLRRRGRTTSVSTFILSKKKGKEAYVEPVIEEGGYRFTVKAGAPPKEAKAGNEALHGARTSAVPDVRIPVCRRMTYIKAESMAGANGEFPPYGDRRRG